jgi:GTP-binding protein Era
MEVSGKGKKSGYCAIVGRPNVGKSTLMNHLIGQKIAITSGKPQTTRTRIRTVYTDERGQIVFLDTPGIHKAKNRLGEYMDELALETLPDSDVILWILDAGQLSREEDGSIRRQLKLVKKPVILVLNKVD